MWGHPSLVVSVGSVGRQAHLLPLRALFSVRWSSGKVTSQFSGARWEEPMFWKRHTKAQPAAVGLGFVGVCAVFLTQGFTLASSL